MSSDTVKVDDVVSYRVEQNPLWPFSATWTVYIDGWEASGGKTTGLDALKKAFWAAEEVAQRAASYQDAIVNYTPPVWIDDNGKTHSFV